MRKRIAIIILLAGSMSSVASNAAESVLVYFIDKKHEPVVRLDRLEPLPESTRAILAMYALQVGSGCQARDESGLRCKLTSALGLGAQCSRKHTDLVQTWFAHGMPRMADYGKESIPRALRARDLRQVCYNAPDGAHAQRVWSTVRLRAESDLVYVDATYDWMARPDGPFGTRRYRSVYQIEANNIHVVSHAMVSDRRRSE